MLHQNKVYWLDRVPLKLHIILITLKSAVQEFHWYLTYHQEFPWNFNTLFWSYWSQLYKNSIDIFITIKSSLETSTHYFDQIEVSCTRIPSISSLPSRVPLKLQHIILITLKSAVQEFHWYFHHHQEFPWNFNTLFWSYWSQLCKNSINIFITIKSSLETSTHYFDHIEVSCARIPLISSSPSRVHLKLQHIILIILKSAVQEFHRYLHYHQEFTWNSTHYFDHIEVSCARIPLITSLPSRVHLKLQHIILIILKSAVQ